MTTLDNCTASFFFLWHLLLLTGAVWVGWSQCHLLNRTWQVWSRSPEPFLILSCLFRLASVSETLGHRLSPALKGGHRAPNNKSQPSKISCYTPWLCPHLKHWHYITGPRSIAHIHTCKNNGYSSFWSPLSLGMASLHKKTLENSDLYSSETKTNKQSQQHNSVMCNLIQCFTKPNWLHKLQYKCTAATRSSIHLFNPLWPQI